MPETIISISKDKKFPENNVVNRKNRTISNLNTAFTINNNSEGISLAEEFESLRILNDALLVKKLRSGSKDVRKMNGKFAAARRIL